ncbi:MAG TPA: hypothetical protein VMN60_12260 [Longimicrobiales bacterium]|nr:hypothetical protein [Longimicrobiales bacterium]
MGKRNLLVMALVVLLASCGDSEMGLVNPPFSPQFNNLEGYSDEEIYHMYETGELQAMFPTAVWNFKVDAWIGPRSYASSTEYEFEASVRHIWAKAELMDGNASIQSSDVHPKTEGSDFLLHVEKGRIQVTTGDVPLAERPCDLYTKGTGGYEVYNAVAVVYKDKKYGLKWAQKSDTTHDFSAAYGSSDPECSDGDGGSTDEKCWYCETWVYEDEYGNVVGEEEVCWEVDMSMCDGIE